MTLIDVFFIGIGLSMDAFAVSVCKGLSAGKTSVKHMALAGAWFGGFQALMPLVGYLLGSAFEQYVTTVDHWIAFILLFIIGANMIREALSKEEEDVSDAFGFKTMFIMAIATSIDALAVGITFVCVPVSIVRASSLVNTGIAVSIIGVITFMFSMAGAKIGNIFGTKYKNKAEFAGGVILILLGLKIIIEHFVK